MGVEDLHRIAMSSLSTKDRFEELLEKINLKKSFFRRASMPMLIEEMYKSMVEGLNGAEAPYPLEKVSVN